MSAKRRSIPPADQRVGRTRGSAGGMEARGDEQHDDIHGREPQIVRQAHILTLQMTHERNGRIEQTHSVPCLDPELLR